MIIKDLRLPVCHSKEQLQKKIERQCGKGCQYRILRRAIDGRKSPVCYCYTIEAAAKGEAFAPKPRLEIPQSTLKNRPKDAFLQYRI